MSPNINLLNSLQSEFCPPLDSSLLAALLADIELDEQGHSLTPTSEQIERLRETLRELSSQADESQNSEHAVLSQIDGSNSPTDKSHANTTTTTTFSSTTSDTSDSIPSSFNSPFGFLQAAFPSMSSDNLSAALENYEMDDVDMWDVVAGILTAEYIREMEERGLDSPEEREWYLGSVDDDMTWGKDKKTPSKAKVNKRKSARKTKQTLGNIRQRDQCSCLHKSSSTDRRHHPTSARDPWTKISSLSSYLATLLPPYPQSFFQSYFHSPDHATPYIALRAVLSFVGKDRDPSRSEEFMETLGTLYEIILPEYDGLDQDERSTLMSEAESSLLAAGGDGEVAFDLVKLLRDLNFDSTHDLKIGIYHSKPSQAIERRSSLPPSTPAPPNPEIQPTFKPMSHTSNETDTTNPFKWQYVPQRRSKNNDPHPLASYIPAYQQYPYSNKKTSGEQYTNEHRWKTRECMRKRNQLLKQATKMWQQGNSRTRGGEAALYFAERARLFQKLAKAEALEAAREMVESRRLASTDRYTVDLHGTTTLEAVTIVKEILSSQVVSPDKPFKIITGRGSHSVNQVGVLKPAIRKALIEDGWNVGTWDGGLIIRGLFASTILSRGISANKLEAPAIAAVRNIARKELWQLLLPVIYNGSLGLQVYQTSVYE